MPKRKAVIQRFDFASDSDGENDIRGAKRPVISGSTEEEKVPYQEFVSGSRVGKWKGLAIPSNVDRPLSLQPSTNTFDQPLPPPVSWEDSMTFDDNDDFRFFGFDSNKADNDDFRFFGFDSNKADTIPFGWLDPTVLATSANLEDLSSKVNDGRSRDNVLSIWEPYRDTYLQELLRLEGRGDFKRPMCICTLSAPRFRCIDCLDNRMWCSACIVLNHHQLPLHHVEEWTGQFFQRSTLAELGLRIQLGDHSGGSCRAPRPAKDFIIIDIGGIHLVKLDFCGCENAATRVAQLLRHRLYPATSTEPNTAATFRVLKLFQMLSFMSKASAYEFYQTLARLTDNTGTRTPRDRYKSFLSMLRQWRHLRMLKRFGRGHQVLGVAGTREGECAVLCPACPQPGVNLPPSYSTEPDAWKYTLFLAFDGNFRLKRFNVSNDNNDPGLNQGYSFCIKDSDYRRFLMYFQGEVMEERSTCNEHKAVLNAQTSGGRVKLGATGLATIDCSRHGFKRPCSLGDFQLGERQINMDYCLMSSLRIQRVDRLILSYDVICQWAINLHKRLQQYATYDSTLSQAVLCRGPKSARFVVPKFHLPAHRDYCKTRFAYHLTPGVGLTDGESVERGWAAANGLANSTKEMGPGHCRDVLDDFFGDFNWRKTTAIAHTLHRKLMETKIQAQALSAAFRDLSASFPPTVIEDWTKLVVAWELDPNADGVINPYDVTAQAITLAKVRKDLASEEADSPTEGGLPTEVTASMMILQGMELEQSQAKHRREEQQLGPRPTLLQESKVLESRTRLQQKIDSWFLIQQCFMPRAPLVRARAPPIDTPSDVPLLLPSGAIESGMHVTDSLAQIEFRLRVAEANDALGVLRRLLLTRDSLYRYKEAYVHSQRDSLRSNTTIQSLQDRMKGAANQYRKARLALEQLSKVLREDEWRGDLCPLLESDCKGLKWGHEKNESESKKHLSWIWKREGVVECVDPINDATGNEALRIEWCRTRARAQRAQEECVLLAEEIRRVGAFLEHERDTWNGRTSVSELRLDSVTSEGCLAYATRQAEIQQQLLDATADVKANISKSKEKAAAKHATDSLVVQPDVTKDAS